ncbi:disease resistance protein Pik-2-like [Triticum dicoccoides]|uniref:disease resistance protein Pik-2-like n=1 Tax=Triticum dicoccoides TaxID=85692 RepID=UPI0018906DBF|nr:disease resistance protein Pik-2-like [Triticum dicoccoides]
MEATAISIGKSVLSGALNYAQSAVAEEVALQLGVQRDHSFISDELEMMRCFLMAAHDERDDSMVVKIWVKQVRDVSYVVEDCLMDFAHTISSAAMNAADYARLLRQKAKMDLVELINCKDGTLRVIALWSTCSSDPGEISIIRSAYEDPIIHKNFDCFAWVTLMRPSNETDFIRSILRQIYVNSLQETGQEGKTFIGSTVLKMMMTTKEDGLAHEFKRYLNDKSYLVVLNEIHTIEEWDCIKTCFPNNKKGSRIIVSTAQVEVASLCIGAEDEALVHKKLSADQSLYAFYSEISQEGRNSAQTGSTSYVVSTGVNSSAHKNIPMCMETMDILEESRLIGRGNEKEEILKLILNRELQQFHAISLWGMGGIGKTTLVRDIYQSQEISSMFDKRACVTVMRPFSLATLLESLTMQVRDKNEDENKTDLRSCLEGKRYLLVLDDLWSRVEWDAIKEYLPETAASCIIVTTREENIAKHCSKEDRNIYKLNHLDPDDAYTLFTKKVFMKTVNLDAQYPELVEQAKLILKKCGGLPLALVTIGGFLANQPKTAFEWRKLNEHISAELEMNPELETIKAVLMKSYDGLPYHLKACFLYLAIFPEDYKIARKRLVRRWIAEGYSSEIHDKSMEEVLDHYFMELISRSMILPSQQSVYSRKEIDSCHVHDLIREIVISKSMEESLVFTLKEGCNLNNQGTGDQCEFENIVDLSHVRSLTVFGNWRPFYISDKMMLLRVLDLEGNWGLLDHHLERIGKLVHLRYLSLRGQVDICQLPNSLGNLRQLQTLDISGTSIRKLPRTIMKLVKMQHILGPGHFEALKDIQNLTRLRKLGVTGINKRNGQELCSAIAHLSCLESLSLHSRIVTGFLDCLDGLSSPPENLQSLKLYGYLAELPQWTQGLRKLVNLKLENSRIWGHYTAIQILGNLPNLVTLRLLSNSFFGEEVHLSFRREAFPSLKVLQLHCIQKLKSVEFEEGVAPKLEVLQYSAGWRPSVGLFSGLPYLPSLKQFMLNRKDWKTSELVEYLLGQLAGNKNTPVLKSWDWNQKRKY